MRAIDRKLWRDLWQLKGQVAAIATVMACGVAVLVMALSTQQALMETAQAYYERYAFADVFAQLKRAPRSLAGRLQAIEGVHTVQTRIVRYASLTLDDFPAPVLGQLVSVPAGRMPRLNQLVIREGRLPAPGQAQEVVLSEPFAEAHSLRPGDHLSAVLNGHRRQLQVVGIALSPEFIYSLGPGALMPDDQRFGVLWMGRQALAAAFDLEGSFNNVTLGLSAGASVSQVIAAADRLLEPFGGVGAIARKDQLSNWFVNNEIDQMGTMARILPAIFLIVAAFLTQMVLARLISAQRSQIGLLKAFGYRHREVAWHYVKMVALIACIGIVLGLLLGAWSGRLNTGMYAELFRFPVLLYRPSASAFVVASAITLATALGAAIGSVRRVALLPPAQAMQPPTPPSYRRGLWSRSRAGRWLDQPTRIILRHIARTPLRCALTVGGVACSVSVLIVALQWDDALDHLGQRYFYDAQRQDLMVALAEPLAADVIYQFEHLPAVMAAEPMHIVSADFQAGAVTHRGSLIGLPTAASLQPIFDDASSTVVAVPEQGLVLGTRLAAKLRVVPGDLVWLTLKQGRRPQVAMPVVRLIETYLGMPAYVHIDQIGRLLHQRPRVAYLSLLIDANQEAALYHRLKALPAVTAIMSRRAAIRSYYGTVVEHLMVFVTLFSLFACALGFGVTYNATRIALSERGRELATLRVLGFTRGEIAYVLLGQVGLLVLLGLPLGCWLGYGLTRLMARAFDTELFRIPLVIEASTYGYAMIIALAAAILSAVLVGRRIHRLDLIEVLKTRG